MSILTSVSDGLALLVSGAAMATAARALWLASAARRAKPAATASGDLPSRGTQMRDQTRAFLADPERPKAFLADAERTRPDRSPVQNARGRGGETREQIRAFLADRADQELSLVQISNGVGRSSATVSYALDKLVAVGDVELTSPKPRRYTITPSGAAAHQPQPQQQAEEARPEPAAPPEPTPAGESETTPQRQSRTRPRARKPATASSDGSTASNSSGRQGRGDQTREQVRAFLADPERVGSDWSLVQVSQGIGRSSATVSYALDKLIQAGEVTLASGKPRRYAIAASAQPQPSGPAGTPKEAAAAAAEPPSPGGRRASRRTPAESAQRKPTRASDSGGRARKKTADAATGKVAATAN